MRKSEEFWINSGNMLLHVVSQRMLSAACKHVCFCCFFSSSWCYLAECLATRLLARGVDWSHKSEFRLDLTESHRTVTAVTCDSTRDISSVYKKCEMVNKKRTPVRNMQLKKHHRRHSNFRLRPPSEAESQLSNWLSQFTGCNSVWVM